MGFQHHQYNTQVDELVMETFGNLQTLFEWFSYLLYGREISAAEVANHITNSSKILAYLEEADKSAWVAMLAKEVSKLSALQKGGQVQPGNEPVMVLPDGEALLAWSKAELLPHVLEAAQAEVQQYNELSRETAIMVRDALLFSCLFGEFGTHRLTHLCTAKAPQHSQGPCTHARCTLGSSCHGNTFEYDEASKQFRFKCPHHKNQFRGQQAPNILITDDTLNRLFSIYTQYARPTLAERRDRGPVDNMFVTNEGCAYQPSTLCNWCTAFMSK
jgi:hypothetical protein